jgi:iron complex outermembrane receptor protein
VAGADFYFIDSDAKSFFGFALPIPSSPTGLTNVDRDSYGFYVHDEFSITPDIILSLGARQEKVEYDLDVQDLTGFFAPLRDSVSETEYAYTAGLTFLYNQNSSVFVRANRSLRFPLVDEIVVFDFIAGQINVNQDLKPQTGMHYEAGVRHFFTSDIQANLTVFRAEIDDEIFLNAITFANENHPETLHQGFEVGAKVTLFDKVRFYGNYTYEKAEFEKDPYKGNDIPAVPEHKWNVGLDLVDVVPRFTFNAQFNYVGDSFAISDQDNAFEKLDSWSTLDLRLSYKWKMLKAFVGVNNVTDEEYSEYAVIGGTGINFYPAPEINYLTGIELIF